MWAIGSSDGSGTSYSQHSSSGYGCNKVNFMGCSSSPTTSSVVSSAGGISSTATSTASSVTCSDSSSWTSSNSKYHVSWNVSQDLAYITFEVTAATQGWVSLGLGTSCNMQNADKIDHPNLCDPASLRNMLRKLVVSIINNYQAIT